MNKFDIEAYLDGSLDAEAREDFEQEMRQNPAFAQQVEAQRKVTELLRKQMLREQVSSALANRPVAKRPYRWVVLAALLILLAGYFLFLRKRNNPTPPIPPPTNWNSDTLQTAPQEPTQNIVQDSLEIKNEKPPKPSPIAENNAADLPLPAYPSPNVRGQGADNAAWKAMLDKVWYTQLPPKAAKFKEPFPAVVASLSKRDFENAFVQLETLEGTSPDNDTLRLLKGYCLLEMGEGADALRYFSKLEESNPNWKAWLEWHRGLSLLSSGEAKKAILDFKKIANAPDHPFRRQARKALNVLE